MEIEGNECSLFVKRLDGFFGFAGGIAWRRCAGWPGVGAPAGRRLGGGPGVASPKSRCRGV